MSTPLQETKLSRVCRRWFVVDHWQRLGGEDDTATTRRVLGWYECQDVDQSGLISMQESSDWQDLFCTEAKVCI